MLIDKVIDLHGGDAVTYKMIANIFAKKWKLNFLFWIHSNLPQIDFKYSYKFIRFFLMF